MRYFFNIILFVAVSLIKVQVASAFTLATPVQYQVCFSPGPVDCTRLIVGMIGSAQKSIAMQAYAFTSRPIAKALVAAKKRGVQVRIIIDRSQLQADSHSRVRYLLAHKMALWQDDTVNIAHNKVIIIDGGVVETGSFNYTYSAGHFNAENVLIIHSHILAQQYLHYWNVRFARSLPVVK